MSPGVVLSVADLRFGEGGGGVLGKGLCVPKRAKARSARGSEACPPPTGKGLKYRCVSCNLGHLLTNFRDSEKEFFCTHVCISLKLQFCTLLGDGGGAYTFPED